MKKLLTIVLAAMLTFASPAFGAEIDSLVWNQSNIKTLRALDKHAVFRFFIRREDPEHLMDWNESNLIWDYHWYPVGDGKYELAVNHQSGPDVGLLTIYWQDAPRKFSSQQFGGAGLAGAECYNGPQFGDFIHDEKTELVQLTEVGTLSPQRTKFIPRGMWPQVYRLRDGKYVEASGDFRDFYEKQVLPQLDQAIAQTRKDIAANRPGVVAPGSTSVPDGGEQREHQQRLERYLAALIMARDKVMRVIGRDPTAGLEQAREWMASSDPVLVDNARAVFEDLGGHDQDVRAAKLALERASEHYPGKAW